MKQINLKEARRRLGTLISAAERGESSIITRRGKRVAMIVPLDREDTEGLPDLTEFRASLEIKGPSLTEELLAMRGEERY